MNTCDDGETVCATSNDCPTITTASWAAASTSPVDLRFERHTTSCDLERRIRLAKPRAMHHLPGAVSGNRQI